jgi:hypothetical protein
LPLADKPAAESDFATARVYCSACPENGIEAEGVAIRMSAHSSA